MQFKVTLSRIIIYGITVGIAVGFLESAIGYEFYSATFHGLGYSMGELNLLPLLIPLLGCLFIWKADFTGRVPKIALFLILNFVFGIVGLLYFPFKF